MLAAVNHSGDSDSTASITGAVLGTLLGVKSIPPLWVQKVEDSAYIRQVATKLYELYGSSKLSAPTGQTVKAVPSMDIECPICGFKLKAPRAGKFKCGKCKQVFELKEDGTFLL